MCCYQTYLNYTKLCFATQSYGGHCMDSKYSVRGKGLLNFQIPQSQARYYVAVFIHVLEIEITTAFISDFISYSNSC